jgi:hypothetical protein
MANEKGRGLRRAPSSASTRHQQSRSGMGEASRRYSTAAGLSCASRRAAGLPSRPRCRLPAPPASFGPPPPHDGPPPPPRRLTPGRRRRGPSPPCVVPPPPPLAGSRVAGPPPPPRAGSRITRARSSPPLRTARASPRCGIGGGVRFCLTGCFLEFFLQAKGTCKWTSKWAPDHLRRWEGLRPMTTRPLEVT